MVFLHQVASCAVGVGAVMGGNWCAYCQEGGVYCVGVERLRVLLFGDWVLCWLCGDCLAALDLGGVFVVPAAVRQSENLFNIKGGS